MRLKKLVNQVIGGVLEQEAAEWRMSMRTSWFYGAAGGRRGMLSFVEQGVQFKPDSKASGAV